MRCCRYVGNAFDLSGFHLCRNILGLWPLLFFLLKVRLCCRSYKRSFYLFCRDSCLWLQDAALWLPTLENMQKPLLWVMLQTWGLLSTALALKAFLQKHRGCLSTRKNIELFISWIRRERRDLKLSTHIGTDQKLLLRGGGGDFILYFLSPDKNESELFLDWNLFFFPSFPPQKPIFNYFINDKKNSYWQLSLLSSPTDITNFFRCYIGIAIFILFCQCFSFKSSISMYQDTLNTTRLESILPCTFFFSLFRHWFKNIKGNPDPNTATGKIL